MNAQTFLNHCYAGLQLVDFQDGEYVWQGDERAWTIFQHLEDGLPLEQALINW